MLANLANISHHGHTIQCNQLNMEKFCAAFHSTLIWQLIDNDEC